MFREEGIILPGAVWIILMIIFAVLFLVALGRGNMRDAAIAGSLLAINIILNVVIGIFRRVKG